MVAETVSLDDVITAVTLSNPVEFRTIAVEALHMSVVVGSHSLCGLKMKLPTIIHRLSAIAVPLPTIAPCKLQHELNK